MAPAPILAVASGKGGVGKTLTSVNLALCAAGKGMRTALVDADPLSNVMSLLDHPAPDRPLPESVDDPASQTFIAAPGLEVIFPQTKESPSLAAALVDSLLENHREWLDSRYSLVIIDMPAGVRAEKDFPYLAKADAFLLVVNPEPTSHVAAGTLLRRMKDVGKDMTVHLWHNRYEARPDEEFDPDDVVGNYNRNVPANEKISPPPMKSIAWIPPDPALDLTRSDPPVSVNLHRSLADALEVLADASLPPVPGGGKQDSRSRLLVEYFLRRADVDADGDAVLGELESFLAERVPGKGKHLPETLESELRLWLRKAAGSPMRKQILKTREVVTMRLKELEAAGGLFAPAGPAGSARAVDREMIPLLKSLSYLPAASPMMRLAALLLYRYALLKLFTNDTAVKLITTFLPHRTENGSRIRDRRKQIARITGADKNYQARYFALVKKLYPVMSRQLDHLVTTFGLQPLLFRGSGGEVSRSAYARLFSASLYEMVNSGLGIVTGFRFRPSSRAFTEGFEALADEIGMKH